MTQKENKRRVKYIVALGLFAMAAIGIALIGFSGAGSSSGRLQIKAVYSNYNQATQSVWSVTFSNTSESMVIMRFFQMDYITNGKWTHNDALDRFMTVGPFFAHDSFERKVSVPRDATAVRAVSCFEHVPAWIEYIAAISGKQKAWELALKFSKGTAETNSSEPLEIPPFTNAAVQLGR